MAFGVYPLILFHFRLIISLSDNSDDNMNQPFDVLKMKQEPTVGEESRSPDNDDPRVCVDISPDCGAFRYKSQLEPVVKKAKSKQDGQIKQGNGCLASVAVSSKWLEILFRQKRAYCIQIDFCSASDYASVD
jgi:hypothetical protein